MYWFNVFLCISNGTFEMSHKRLNSYTEAYWYHMGGGGGGGGGVKRRNYDFNAKLRVKNYT